MHSYSSSSLIISSYVGTCTPLFSLSLPGNDACVQAMECTNDLHSCTCNVPHCLVAMEGSCLQFISF